MAYPYDIAGPPYDYPTQDNLAIGVNRTPVEQVHWDDGVIEKQNYVYAYRRGFVFNRSFATRILTITAGAAYPAIAEYEIPITASMFTIDDYDANVRYAALIRYEVTGAGTGYVRVQLGGTPTSTEFSMTAGGYLWESRTIDIAKLASTGGLLIDLKADAATTTNCTHCAIYAADQTTIGV